MCLMRCLIEKNGQWDITDTDTGRCLATDAQTGRLHQTTGSFIVAVFKHFN